MAASARSRRETRTPLRLAQRRKRRRILFSVLIGIAFVASVGGIIYASYQPVFAIEWIEISGAEEVGESEVRAAVEHILYDDRFHIVSQFTALTYPGKHIEVDLKERFKRIEKVEVSVNSLLRPSVRVTIVPREPHARWCSDESLAECYIMDNDGYIFAPLLTEIPLEQRVVYVGVLTEAGMPVGQWYQRNNWRGLQAMVTELANSERPVRTIRTVDVFDYEAVLENGLVLKLSYERSPEDMLQDLLVVLSADALQGRESELSYIDLRFAGRVYYLLKSE